MTFTEAAIEVLRREGKPLHFKKITEIAVRENLLDHVGKIPEEVMADQVAAHCRLPRLERKLQAVQHATFALVEWGLEEDAHGLENLVEPPPVDDMPYRGRERHPAPSRELSRGRGDKGRRREEGEEKRSRRFPPPAEVAYEILAGAGQPLALGVIAAQGAERLIMPDAFVRDADALGAALVEDNRRREQGGRRPLFQLDGDLVTLVAQPEPGERVSVVAAAVRPSSPAELRRAGLAALRRRLRECDAATVEHLAARLLERLGFREVKVAKRGREHVIYTGRKRMGLADVRHAVRVVRTGADAARRDVVDTRRDLGHYGAQIGVVITAGEAAREARGEAGAAGQLPVILLAGEALAEAFADAGLGCVPVIVPDVDEAFFAAAAEIAQREEEARRARREERDQREGGRPERRERREERAERRPVRAEAEAQEMGSPGGPEADAEPQAGADAAATPEVEGDASARPSRPPQVAAEEAGEGDDGDEGDGDDGDEADEADEAEGPGAEGAAEAGAPGEPRPAGEGGRRRRRRRRRRGGRGRGERREGTPAGGEAQGGPAGEPAAASPAPPVDAPPAGGGDAGGA